MLRTPFRRFMNRPYKFRTLNNRGLTLIEMIIIMAILSIISAITLYFLVASVRVYALTVNQKTLLEEGKLALERMCRDIRDAKSISSPGQGSSGNLVTFVRTNATVQDSANETITFQQTGNTLEKVKTSPSVTRAMADNVTAFTITRGTGNDEIKIFLTLSLGTGENVTIQTKVYPKNLADSSTYKNYFAMWQEEWSS